VDFRNCRNLPDAARRTLFAKAVGKTVDCMHSRRRVSSASKSPVVGKDMPGRDLPVGH
jgi:hypothetical protein